MAKTIATVGGIALAPGISRNGRLYTKPAIASMVARAQERIESGQQALTIRDVPDSHVISQLTHHAAVDDSTRIVGRVTGLSLDESGNARFTAEIAPTQAGWDIAALLDTSDGSAPFLRGVSIRAAWVGGARIGRGPDGQAVETGDDLELNGLDYTHKPGVTAAAVDTFAWTDDGAKTETTDRVLITESVEEAHVAPVTEDTTPAAASAIPAAFRAVVPEPGHQLADGACVTCAEATEAAAPMGKRGSGTTGTGGPYADPGYQTDKKQRYQLDTKAHAKAAWSFISKAENAKAYTAAQLKRIKGRIMKALKGFGVTVSTAEAAGWSFDAPVALDEAVGECYGGYAGCDPDRSGSWSLNASNGPVNLCLSSYGMDPAELDVILRAAADAACKALAALDPDMDGDIDVAGAPNADSDHDAGETDDLPEDAEPAETADAGPGEAPTPAPDPAAGTTQKEDSVMPETRTPAAETTAAPTFTQADLDAAATSAATRALEADRVARKARKAARRAPAETAQTPAAPVSETAPAAPAAATESEDDRINRIVAARIAAELGPEETEDERIERLVNTQLDAARARLVQSGQVAPGRKGLVRGANESTDQTPDSINEATGLPASWGSKQLHEMNQDELTKLAGPVLVRHVLGAKADLIG